MKPHRLYIIMCILSLLAFAGCRDEEPVQSAESKRTITVNLGIAMSRATDIEGVIGDKTRPDNLQLWIFDGNTADATLIFHENITEDLTFSITDLNNRLVQTIERIINVENEINTLHFYIVMNTTGISLDKNSNPHNIETATFTQQTTWTGDNKVPLYGYGTLDVSTHRSEYSVSIEATRAVGKLELLFTKENSSSYLRVNNIQLEHVPDKGYLAAMPDHEPTNIYTETIENILAQKTIILTSSNAEMGNFSEDEAHFTLLDLTQDYLLENPNGGTWAEVNGNNDYTYTDPYDPDKQADNDYTEGNIRYKMTVTYQTVENGEEKAQVVYLPEIKRNYWNKIFVRVKGGTLQIQYKAMPWKTVITSIGYAPQPVFPGSQHDEEAKTVFDSDNRFESEDYFILLPKAEYDNAWLKDWNPEEGTGYPTRKLMDHLYENPKEGDPEAVLGYVCRPGYVIDNEDAGLLEYLKSGSGGARFYFMLTGPEGATWEAHLTNKEDFAFSTTYEENEFENSEYPKGIYKVTHGIARLKPYVIQIIATNNYTGTSSDNPDDGIEEYPEITVNGKKQHWGDKKYFGDEYLTTWGKEHWENHEEINTEFYITVKLTDGAEYELAINPSYNGYAKFDDADFYYRDRRRYAGKETRIKIRQLRAQYYGTHDIYDYEDMAKHVENRSEDEWWRVNPYWRNTDNE